MEIPAAPIKLLWPLSTRYRSAESSVTDDCWNPAAHRRLKLYLINATVSAPLTASLVIFDLDIKSIDAWQLPFQSTLLAYHNVRGGISHKFS